MQAVAAAFDITINAREMSLLCQTVRESRGGRALRRDGSDDGVVRRDQSPAGAALPAGGIAGNDRYPGQGRPVGTHSGVRHAVTGADYGSVRVGAFIGYRIIAEMAG